jgi:transposase
MDGTFFGVFAAILLIGALLLAVMTLTKKGGVKLDVDKYRSKWLAIENQLKRDEVSSFHLSVLNADKLLDQALRERGIKGETMGERMKTIKDTWTNANAVWTAHKLRNQIAHESDVQVSYDDARRALASFKQALKDVGAI